MSTALHTATLHSNQLHRTPTLTSPARHNATSHYITPHFTTLHHTTLHHTTSHYTTSHHTSPHHTSPHYTTSHHITLHRTTLHHTTLHHTTSLNRTLTLTSPSNSPGYLEYGSSVTMVREDTNLPIATTATSCLLTDVPSLRACGAWVGRRTRWGDAKVREVSWGEERWDGVKGGDVKLCQRR